MTQHSLVIDGQFKGVYPSPDEAKRQAEILIGFALEWDRHGSASFISPDDSSRHVAKVSIGGDPDTCVWRLQIRAWPNSLHPSLEDIVRKIGRSKGGNGNGFLTDWVEIPHLRMWVALYWDSGMGIEIATATKIR